MTAIRSLADELREKMRQQAAGDDEADSENTTRKVEKQPGKKKAGKPPPQATSASLEQLFSLIDAFELTGNEKLLIRLDNRTVFMLKQLKVVKGIDMNKLIAYSVEAFFKERPELINFIKSTLQTIEL